LVDRLPDLNQRFGYLKQTPLMITIENCMTDLAEYLIKEKKVDLTVVDENEQSALHYACENDEEEIANIIIEQMKDDSDYLNQLDGDAMSPLIFAVQNCCTSTVAKLLSLNVAWRYTYDGGNEKMMSALLEANDVSIFKEFQTRLSSAYWKYIEKSKEQSAIVNRALENSNLEILKEILPQYRYVITISATPLTSLVWRTILPPTMILRIKMIGTPTKKVPLHWQSPLATKRLYATCTSVKLGSKTWDMLPWTRMTCALSN
jgi:hypothetical protein